MSAEVKQAPGIGNLEDPLAEREEGTENEARTNEAHVKREAKLRWQRDYAESIIDTVHEPILVLDSDLRVESASRSFYETFGVTPDATIGQFLYDLGNGEWDIPALRRLLESALPKQIVFRDFEVAHDFPSLGRRVMLLNGRTLLPPTDDRQRVLLAIEDVTERKRIQDDLVRSKRGTPALLIRCRSRSALSCKYRATELANTYSAPQGKAGRRRYPDHFTLWSAWLKFSAQSYC